MKRSEFLKRFGLGVAAAVTAPALLKGEEKAEKYHKAECLADVGKAEKLVFWRQSDEARIIPTSWCTYELSIPAQYIRCEPNPISIDFERGLIINNETGEITNFDTWK